MSWPRSKMLHGVVLFIFLTVILSPLSKPMAVYGAALTAPSVTSPSNGATVETGDVTIRWKAVTGAVSYGLGVVDDTANKKIVNKDDGISATAYTIPSKLIIAGHKYRYSVGAIGQNSQKWVENRTFTVKGAELTAPSVTSPSNGATVETGDVTIRWKAVTGATSYGLGVVDDTANKKIVNKDDGISTTAYTIPSKLIIAGHKYRYSVGAIGQNGQKWVENRTFTVKGAELTAPSVTSPSNGATVETGDVTIRWKAVTGATSYGLGVVDDTANKKIVNKDDGISATAYTIPSKLIIAGHKYRYSVGAIGQNGQKWVENRTFTVKGAELTAPSVTSPSNGATVETGDVTIRWKAVSGAVGYGLGVVDDTANKKIVNKDDGISATAYTIPSKLIIAGHNYRYSVGAIGQNGQKWVENRTFTVKGAELTAPSVTSPSNGAAVDPGDVTIRWNAVTGATSYGIGVVDDTANKKIVNKDDGISATAYTIPSKLIIAGHKYRYSVGAIGQNGQKWVENRTFTVKGAELAAPSVTSPSNGATVDPGDVTIRWNAVTGATSYGLGVVDDTANKKIVNKDDGISATAYTIPSKLIIAGHKYRYSVGAIGQNGQKWVENRTFTVKALPLIGPAIITPVDGTVITQAKDINVSWKAVDGAKKYFLSMTDVTDLKDSSQEGVAVLSEKDCGNQTSYTIPASILKQGKMYRIVIAAEANNQKKWGNAVRISIDISVAPTGLVASPGNDKITLKWTKIPGALKYYVYRSDTQTGSYVKIGEYANWTEEGYADRNVIAEKTYWYRVSAVNSSGNQGPQSAALKVVNHVETPLVPTVSVQSEIKVILNGNHLTFDVPPQIIEGRTLVPLRTIFEALGAKVDWNGATQTITATKGSENIVLRIGDVTAYKNKIPVILDVPATIVNGKTFVPLRFVSEALDTKVFWDENNKKINMVSNSNQGQTELFNVYQNDDLLKTFQNQDEAIKYAREYDNTTVKNGIQVVWKWHGPYYVYQYEQFLEMFPNKEEAIAYAKGYNNSIVKKQGEIVWSFAAPLELSKTLVFGDKGDEIKNLQEKLSLIGMDCATDGTFGKYTMAAVIALQIVENLEVDGKVGNNTNNKINELIKEKIDDVKRQKLILTYKNIKDGIDEGIFVNSSNVNGTKYLQAILQEYFKLSIGKNGIDGRYGDSTRDAVIAVQKYKKLDLIDGKVGPLTWNAIFEVLTNLGSNNIKDMYTIQLEQNQINVISVTTGLNSIKNSQSTEKPDAYSHLITDILEFNRDFLNKSDNNLTTAAINLETQRLKILAEDVKAAKKELDIMQKQIDIVSNGYNELIRRNIGNDEKFAFYVKQQAQVLETLKDRTKKLALVTGKIETVVTSSKTIPFINKSMGFASLINETNDLFKDYSQGKASFQESWVPVIEKGLAVIPVVGDFAGATADLKDKLFTLSAASNEAVAITADNLLTHLDINLIDTRHIAKMGLKDGFNGQGENLKCIETAKESRQRMRVALDEANKFLYHDWTSRLAFGRERDSLKTVMDQLYMIVADEGSTYNKQVELYRRNYSEGQALAKLARNAHAIQ